MRLRFLKIRCLSLTSKNLQIRIKASVTVRGFKELAEAGGLLAYGVNRLELWRRAAYFVDRILKGAKPGDLPIERPTKFELVVNMKTAKALGIKIPNSILVQATKHKVRLRYPL